MSTDLWEVAERIDVSVDNIFVALPEDIGRIQHELNGLRRLAAQAREATNAYAFMPAELLSKKPKVELIRVRDVLLREGVAGSFWRVLRVRRKRNQVDVVDQEGRQRIYNVCEFCQHWSSEEASQLNLQWRY